MVKFFKRTDIGTNPSDCNGTLISKIYGDMFHGKAETVDILGNPSLFNYFIDLPSANSPTFGEAEVVGYKLGLKVQSVTQGDSNTLPELKIYKAKRDIKGRTGTFINTDGTGNQQIITNSGSTDNIYAMSTYPSDSFGWEETFSTFEEVSADNVKTWETTTTVAEEAYLDAEWAKENAQYIGPDKMGSDKRKFDSRYVTMNAEGNDVVYVTEKTDYGGYLRNTYTGAVVGSQIPFVGTIVGAVAGAYTAHRDDGGKCFVPTSPQNTSWYNDLPKWDVGDAESAGALHYSSKITMENSEDGDMLTNENSIFNYVETTENITGATAEGNETPWVESKLNVQTKVKSQGSRALKSSHVWKGSNTGGKTFDDAPEGQGHPNLTISRGEDADFEELIQNEVHRVTQSNVQCNYAGFSGIPAPIQLGGWNSVVGGSDNVKFDSLANTLTMRVKFDKLREVIRYGSANNTQPLDAATNSNGTATQTGSEVIMPLESCFAVTFSEKEPKTTHTLTDFFQEEVFVDPYSAATSNSKVGYHMVAGGNKGPLDTINSQGSMYADPTNLTIFDYSQNRIKINELYKGTDTSGIMDFNKGLASSEKRAVMTGDLVYYKRAGSADIGGLTTKTFYYAIADGDTRMKLATTKANADAGTAIDLTGPGSATGEHSFVIPRLHYGGQGMENISAGTQYNGSSGVANAAISKLYGYLDPAPKSLDSDETDYSRDFNGVMFYKKEGSICISPFNHGSKAGGKRAGTVFTSHQSNTSINWGDVTCTNSMFSIDTEGTGKCLLGNPGCRNKATCDGVHYPSGIGTNDSYWLPDDNSTTTSVKNYDDGATISEQRIVKTNMSTGKWYDLDFIFPWNKDYCELHIFETGKDQILETVKLWNVHSTAHSTITNTTGGTHAKARIAFLQRYNSPNWDGKTIVLTDNDSPSNTVTFTIDDDSSTAARTDASNYVAGIQNANDNGDIPRMFRDAVNLAFENGDLHMSAYLPDGEDSNASCVWLTQTDGARAAGNTAGWGNTAISGTAITGTTGTYGNSGDGVFCEAFGFGRTLRAFDGGRKESSTYGDAQTGVRINRDNWTPCLTLWHTNTPAPVKTDTASDTNAASDYHPHQPKTKETGVTNNSDTASDVYVDSLSYRHMNFAHNNNTISEDNVAYDKLVMKNHEVRDLTPTTDLIKKDKYELINHRGYVSLGFEDLSHLKRFDTSKYNYLFFNNFGCQNLSNNAAIPDANLLFTYTQNEKLGVQLQTIFEGDYPLRINTDIDHDVELGVDGFSQKGIIKIDTLFDGSHGSDAKAIQKRENILTSARILSLSNSNNDVGFNTITVDEPSIFRCGKDTEYIVYRYGEDNIPRNIATVKLSEKGDTQNQFILNKNIKYVDQPKLTVSNLTITNSDTRWNFDEDGDETADGVSWLVSDYYKVGDTIKVTGFTGGNSGLNTSYVITAISSSSSYTGQYFETADVGTAPGSAVDDITFQLDAATTGDDASLIKAYNSNYLDVKDEVNQLFISPKKYWFIIGYQNYITNSDDEVEILPAKTYSGVLTTSFDDSATPTIPDSNSNEDFGCTFNEHLYTDGQYARSWSLDVDSTSVLSTDVDYGFGTWDKEKQDGGYVASHVPVLKFDDSSLYNEIDISGIIAGGSYEGGDILSLLISPSNNETNHKITIATHENDTATNRPYLLTVFEDKIMEDPQLQVKPHEKDNFYPEFTWNNPSKDSWYGFLMISDKNIYNQYDDAVIHYPLNFSGEHGTAAKATDTTFEKISGLTTIISGPTYHVEGLAGHCLNFDGTNDYIRCGTPNTNINTAATNDATASATSEMSIIAHIVPNSGASDDRYIVSQEDTNGRKFSINLNSSNQVVAKVYRTDSDYVSLTSSSVVTTDGETPTNIILTVDTTLTTGNIKLFINGKLEDLTGAALSTGTTNNWQKNATMQSANGYVVIGNSSHSSVTLDRAFDGKIEEIVIYSKCLYPVIPSDSKFLFSKPTSELVSGLDIAQSKSNTARLFIKDFHNIRGATPQEVCTSSQVSWRKAAFALETD